MSTQKEHDSLSQPMVIWVDFKSQNKIINDFIK